MINVWDILSTMGKDLLLFEYPTVQNAPDGTHDILTCIMISPTVLKLQRMVSRHGTEHPHGTHDIPPRAS